MLDTKALIDDIVNRRLAPEFAWISLLAPLPPHPKQAAFVESVCKRIAVKAGRRGGKTTGLAIRAVKRFTQGRRQLYAAPTTVQIEAFWYEVKRMLQPALDAGYLYKNESDHTIEIPGTRYRIRAKTAWNADTLRGDYADDLYLDEWQLMDEDAWTVVGAPMLLDNDGDAVFVFTPPSIRSRSVSKARDKRHALKLFAKAEQDTSGRWEAHHFTSQDNPNISKAALEDIALDMTALSYRQEILAEDVTELAGALWKQAVIDMHRLDTAPTLSRLVIAIDPAVTATEDSDETGIVVAGSAKLGGVLHGFVLGDLSLKALPEAWARRAVQAYHEWEADALIAEINNGGDMVKLTLRTVDPEVTVKTVRASRGKAIRAEPIAALYEQGRVHHVGVFPLLEEQMTGWLPGDPTSPDRLDALVWALSDLMLKRDLPPARSYPG